VEGNWDSEGSGAGPGEAGEDGAQGSGGASGVVTRGLLVSGGIK